MFPYIDDSFIIADTENDCIQAVDDICTFFTKMGFMIDPEKSVLRPTHKHKFLGFFIDSPSMEVSITEDKVDKLTKFANQILYPVSRLKIRQVAVVIVLMIAYSPAIMYGSAHIKSLEIDKNLALARTHDNFARGQGGY